MTRRAFLLILLAAVLLPCRFALADTTTTGVVDKITADNLALTSGDLFTPGDQVNVTLLGGRQGAWRDVQAGDRVQVTADENNRISSIQVLGKLPVTRRVERSLTEFEPVDGHWSVQHNVIVNGRTFDVAGVIFPGHHYDKEVTFSNQDNFDVLEAWIGKQRRSGQGSITLEVLGDGEKLYESPPMTSDDEAVQIRVVIRGRHVITLDAMNADGHSLGVCGVWADPVVVKLPPPPSNIPILVSPEPGEHITQDSPLVWKPVPAATGYLPELQCIQLANPADQDAENRFLLLRIPAGTTVYNFDHDKMPKGRWWWRVHALDQTRFLGHMNDWHSFISE